MAIKSRLAPVAINHHVTQQPPMTEKGNGHTNVFIGLHELEEIFIHWLLAPPEEESGGSLQRRGAGSASNLLVN